MIIVTSVLLVVLSDQARSFLELMFAELSTLLAEHSDKALWTLVVLSCFIVACPYLPSLNAKSKLAVSLTGGIALASALLPRILALQGPEASNVSNHWNGLTLDLQQRGEGFLTKADEFDRLAWLTPYWQKMLDSYDDFTIMSGSVFLIHEIVYFAAWVPYLVMDMIPWFHQFKIQPDKKNDWPRTWKCLKRLLFSHFVIQMPMILLTKTGLVALGFTMETPLPRLSTMLWKCALMFVVEDFYFYWIHRFLHWKKIYKYIHKVHHEHAAPFGIAAEYAHPVETMFLGVGTILGPLLLTRHLLTLWVWLIVRILETIEDHSGYELPWNPTNLIPFWGGSVHHDHHHKTFDGNYGSVFTVWDRVFGTDIEFRKAQERKRALHKSKWNDTFDKLQLTGVPRQKYKEL